MTNPLPDAAPIAPSHSVDTSPGWRGMSEILVRVSPPTFPARRFTITDYGARAASEADSSAAFAAAIDACGSAGGGYVDVPPGTWLSGPIRLRSNICLHIAAGATIRFQTDPEAFLPSVATRWEGVECFGYSPLIYALDAENVAISGAGVLDGQASNEHWWPWKGKSRFGWQAGKPNQAAARSRLFAAGEEGAPHSSRSFGHDSFLRPAFIQMVRCRNVLIDGVTLRRAPMWNIHPVLCRNVVVRRVTVDSHGPNNDGCVPDSCTDVLIEDCTFDTGDDCIAIKSGRNADGRRVGVPSENIIVRRCRMREGHGGVVIGSEISGGCRNVFVEDCIMSSPNLERALRIKTNSHRGGIVENIFVRRIEVGEVHDAVVRVNFFYEEGAGGSHLPVVRNIWIEHLTSRKSNYALFLAGFPESPVRDVHLRACRFDGVARGSIVHNVVGLDFDAMTPEKGIPFAREIAIEDS